MKTLIWGISFFAFTGMAATVNPTDLGLSGSQEASVGSALDTETRALLEDEYQEWKANFVTSQGASGGLRVRRPEDGDSTVSEGQGYGMLLAASLGDQQTFDGLWKYTQRYLDPRGLMHWKIDRDGKVVGQNAATDADEDIAFALIAADGIWGGGGYASAARDYLAAMFEHEVEPDTYVLRPGDVWGGSEVMNPSYCAPAFYRVFAEFTRNGEWLKVLDSCYEILEKAQHPVTGLLPEWSTSEGGSAVVLTHNKNKDNFSYNAIRVPWRLGSDWLWNEDPRAQALLSPMVDFFQRQSRLYSGYTLPGTPLVSYLDTVFVAGFAAGSHADDPGSSFTLERYEELVKKETSSYYGATLRLLVLLQMNGMLIHPQELLEPQEETPPENLPSEDEAPTEPEGTATTSPEIEVPKETPEETPDEAPEETPPPPPPPAPPEAEEENSDHSINVEFPADGSTISGEKKLKAYIPDLPLDAYSMTYSAGTNIDMPMENAAGKFKQAKIQFDEWDWAAGGPYQIRLTARDTSSNIIAMTDLILFVKH